MPDIRDYIVAKIRPYSNIIIVLVLLAVFITLAVYVYQKYGTKLLKKRDFDDVANDSSVKREIKVTIYTVDWCPHCKAALPEWDLFSNSYNGKIINGYKIQCVTIDCTDPTPNVSEQLSKHGIDSYPTVLLMRGNDRYDFDAKIKFDSLEKFVEAVSQEP